MMTIRQATSDRREAIARTTAAVVRLAARPALKEDVDLHADIVNDGFCNDREAWEALHALEDLVRSEGLISPQESANLTQARQTRTQLETKAAVAAATGQDAETTPGEIYIAWDRLVCLTVRCAGYKVVATGVTVGGAAITRLTDEDAIDWEAQLGQPARCECGAVFHQWGSGTA